MGSPIVFVAVGLYLFGFVFFAYFCLLADPEESHLADLLTRNVPDYVSSNLVRLVGNKRMERLNIIAEYFLQLAYLVIVLGSWSIIFTFAYPWVSESSYVSNYHKYVGVAVFLACMTSFRWASNVSPGYITKTTLSKFDNYPYDNLLFPPQRICPTVGIPKLARSKFDRFSGVHVARFDHFCGWLHNPIGEENYRYFLLFLFVHILSCAYGTVVTTMLFRGEVLDKKLLDVTFINPLTGEEFRANWWVVAQYLFQRKLYVAGVFLLMAVMVVVLTAFLGYHIWLTSRGMTTNESVKWGQVKKWHRQESKRYEQAVKDGLVPAVVNNNPETSNAASGVVADGDVTCMGADVKTQENGANKGAGDAPQVADPGPMPSNIYDVGFVENWKEVIYPRSLRKEALDRFNRSLHSSTSQPEKGLQQQSKPKAS